MSWFLCITWTRSKNEQRECRWIDLLRNSSFQKSLFRSERSGDGHLDTGLLFVDLVEIIALGQCDGHVPNKSKNWILPLQLAVPPADWPGHKTLSLTVTRFKKTCGKDDPVYRWGTDWLRYDITYNWGCALSLIWYFQNLAPPCRRCSSSSRTCVRKDLFCDGRINCALPTSKPPDETSCRWGWSCWWGWWRAIALCNQVFLFFLPISVQDFSLMPLKWIKLVFPAWQRVHLNQNLRCGRTRGCPTSPASSSASSSLLFSSPMSPRTFNRRRRRPAQSVSLTGGYKKSPHWGSFTKLLLYTYSSQNWIHFGCGFEILQSL